MSHKIVRLQVAALAAAIALVVAGCGGSGDGQSVAMPETPEPGIGMQDYVPLDGWEVVRSDSLGPVGVQHDEYGLRASYSDSLVPHISASAPDRQPTVSGTWNGEWGAYIGQEITLHTGDARVDVTLDPVGANAILSYDDVPGFGDISSNVMSIVDGSFQGTQAVPGALGTFNIRGQFGGTDQAGVAGYVHGPGFYSVFHGER